MEAIDDGVDTQHRLPILAKDIEAHIAIQVNVGVKHLLARSWTSGSLKGFAPQQKQQRGSYLRFALHLWGIVWIGC